MCHSKNKMQTRSMEAKLMNMYTSNYGHPVDQVLFPLLYYNKINDDDDDDDDDDYVPNAKGNPV